MFFMVVIVAQYDHRGFHSLRVFLMNSVVVLHTLSSHSMSSSWVLQFLNVFHVSKIRSWICVQQFVDVLGRECVHADWNLTLVLVC